VCTFCPVQQDVQVVSVGCGWQEYGAVAQVSVRASLQQRQKLACAEREVGTDVLPQRTARVRGSLAPTPRMKQ
jgi:hypothetical protein